MADKERKNLKSVCLRYSRRVINRKNFVLMILMFITINIYTSPIKEFSGMVNYKTTPWIYPFLISDANFLALFMAGVIYYFSNVPFMQRTNSYNLLRQGRRVWIKEQLIYILVSAIAITGVSILLSIFSLIPYVRFEQGWGKVLYTLARTDAGQMTELFWDISLQFIRNYNPGRAMLFTILLMVIGITFVGMLMLFSSMYMNKSVSVIIATVLIIYSSLVANIGNAFEKKFAMFSPISWLRVTRIDIVEYGFAVSPSLYYIIICFGVMILVMSILIIRKCKLIDFVWENEEG